MAALMFLTPLFRSTVIKLASESRQPLQICPGLRGGGGCLFYAESYINPGSFVMDSVKAGSLLNLERIS